MAQLDEIISRDLKESGEDEETIKLWKSISKWYLEGGSDTVEEELMKMAKEIRKVANRQLKETKQVMPKKKKKKGRR